MRQLFSKFTEGKPSGMLSVNTGRVSVKYPYSIPIVILWVVMTVAGAAGAVAGVAGLAAVTASTASAGVTSSYINADLDYVKIGDLYYDLNTRTHKAALVYEHSMGEVLLGLDNYEGITSLDVPSTIKFLNPANYYKEEEFTVVEIAVNTFYGMALTHLSIPSTVVYLGPHILYGSGLQTWENNGGAYFDNCMTQYTDRKDKYGEYLHEFKVRENTRLISNECIHAAYIRDLYFPEGKIIFSGDIFKLGSKEKNAIERIELWGTEVDGYFVKEQGDLIVYNYSGKIDYTLTSLYSINKMYVTRDVASLHPAKKWGDKVETFRFISDGLYYELLNKEEAVVVKDDYYAQWGSKSITIPSTVTYNNHTFKVTTIDPEAFAGTNLTSVTLPGTIKTIGQGAFSGCKILTEVNFADEINVIGKQAFMGCTALKEINLNQVANIASEAFKGCTALTTLISGYQGIINAHSLAFDGLNKGNITVQVQSSLLSSYKADAFWKDFKFVSNRYKIDGLWYEIGKTAAMLVKEKNGEGNYSELTGKVTVPKDIVIDGKYYTVTSIEKGALQYAPMTELDLRAEVTTIPEGFCFAASELE